MMLHDVHQGIQKNKARKRIGRGTGSGHGKTAGRGHKGYFSRSGSRKRTGFRGGSTPLALLVAKRGFNNNAFATKVLAVNVSRLNDAFDDGDEVSAETIKSRGIGRSQWEELKILGDGELSKKLVVKAHRFSAAAEKKITDAGGEVHRV